MEMSQLSRNVKVETQKTHSTMISKERFRSFRTK